MRDLIKSLAAALLMLAVAGGMLVCPVMALLAYGRGSGDEALCWLMLGAALFAGFAFFGSGVEPGPEPRAEEPKREVRVKLDMHERNASLRKAGLMCPRCGSTDVVRIGTTGSPVSVGKAIVGGAVAGPTGAVIGAALGKRGHPLYVCKTCGNRYEAR